MRISKILNLLLPVGPLPPPHAHGSKVGGRLYPYQLSLYMKEVMQQRYLLDLKLYQKVVEERIAAKHLEEESRLAEARYRQSMMKTALFATILSEL